MDTMESRIEKNIETLLGMLRAAADNLKKIVDEEAWNLLAMTGYSMVLGAILLTTYIQEDFRALRGSISDKNRELENLRYAVTSLNGEVRRLNGEIESLRPKRKQPPAVGDLSHVVKFLFVAGGYQGQGSKIAAIKLAREMYGINLPDAKNLVEKWKAGAAASYEVRARDFYTKYTLTFGPVSDQVAAEAWEEHVKKEGAEWLATCRGDDEMNDAGQLP